MHRDRVEEAFARFETFTNLERDTGTIRSFRLERMRSLLAAFGNPHRGLRFLHIAGSKGKGSTAAFLARVLRRCAPQAYASPGAPSAAETPEAFGPAGTPAGGPARAPVRHGRPVAPVEQSRVGVYASPHVTSYRERITLTDEPVPDAVYLDALDAAYRYAEATSGDEVPTTFELLTLTAFLVFRRLQCDWVVLETGLGGRLDATNVVEPVATVITPIELEHTEYLGDSLAEIAAEKAGIVKPGVPLFLSPQHDAAREVLTRVAADRGAGCYELEELLTDLRVYNSTRGSTVSMQFRGDPEPYQCTLAMIGRMQAQNASLALLVGRTLFPETETGCLLEALAETRLAGRFEILWSGASHSAATSGDEDRIPVVLDGAHTPHSIEALRTSFLELFGAGGVLIFGCAANKRHDAMAELLAPHFSHCVIARPGTFKQSEPERILESFRRYLAEPRCELILEAEPALRRAVELARRTPARAVLVTGSFYLVSEIRARLMLDSGETHSL